LSESEPTPATSEPSEKPVVKEVPEPVFEIKTIDDLQKMMVIAKGGDPNAIQAITKFMDFQSNAERSYFPDKTITLCTAQLSGYGKVFFPTDDWNPFSLVADVIAVHFMGYKGYKSNQFVDMTRQTTNLDALQTSSEETKQSVIARILGRGKTE